MNAKIDISAMQIYTDRLLMRPWQEEDLDDFFNFAHVPGVEEMSGCLHHKSIKDTEIRLNSFIQARNCFALYHKEDKKLIGYLELHGSWAAKDPRFAHLNVTELGTVVAKDYWGYGIAAEAAKAGIHHCFTHLNIDAVTVCHFLENIQSRRVIEKCGFQSMQEDKFYSKNMDKKFMERQYILFKEDYVKTLHERIIPKPHL